jgi:hypothetical protein
MFFAILDNTISIDMPVAWLMSHGSMSAASYMNIIMKLMEVQHYMRDCNNAVQHS